MKQKHITVQHIGKQELVCWMAFTISALTKSKALQHFRTFDIIISICLFKELHHHQAVMK